MLDKILKKWKITLVFLVISHTLLLLNLKFTAWPEMTFWPYLILKGWLPYRDIAIAHNPFLLVELVIFYWFFGIGLVQLKVYTYLLVILLDLTLFFIVNKLWQKKLAFIALLFYIPLQIIYEGNGLWFDLYLTFPILLCYYFLRKQNYIVAGVFWTIGFLSKQTAIWFLIPITIYTFKGLPFKGGTLQDAVRYLATQDITRKIKSFISGGLIIFLPFLFIVWRLGILNDYFFWAYEFGIKILPMSSGQIHTPSIKQVLVSIFPFSILLVLLVKKRLKIDINLTSWIIFGLMGVIPRWELFHFQPALPFLAIFLAIVLTKIEKENVIRYAIFTYVVLIAVMFSKTIIRDFRREDRFFDSDFMSVVNYVDYKTEDGSQIFILNAWDSVYSLSNTLPAVRPWIPHLSWYMELEGVQEEMINDLKTHKPSMVVMRPFETTGLSSYQPKMVEEYINNNYLLTDMVGNHQIFNMVK
jgi:hypothetical protein